MSGRLAFWLVFAVIALNGIVLAVRELAPEPEGRDGSSLATQPRGVQAWADLLEQRGHTVRRLREKPRETLPDPRTATVVVVEPDEELDGEDAAALGRFVRAGGRLATAGRRLATVHEELDAEPAPARGENPPAPVRVGRGEAVLLDTAAPLRNGALGEGANAALALRLAGDDAGGAGAETRRTIVFVESVHGLNPATGLAALPASWKALLIGLALAALTLMWSRIRRFGPAEHAARELPPPRRAYVDAVAGTLRRTGDPLAATANVRAEARRLVAARAGLPPEARPEEIQAAARRLGLPADEVAALAEPPASQDAVLASAGALARLRNATS